MTVQCPKCGGVPGAHSLSCPTLTESSSLPAATPIPGSTGACAACGSVGFHKANCPLAMVSRPDPAEAAPKSAHAVISKVLHVHRDIGNTATPDAMASEILAELAREGYRF